MKTLLLLLLTCLPLCAATTYPMLSTTTNRTVTGGTTNLSFLNSNSVFTGTARWMGIVTLTNTGNIFVGDGAGLTGVGFATSGGVATNATIYGLTINTGSTNNALTGSRAMVTDANKGIVSSATTATELGFVSGVTSAIQTQINAKAASATLGGYVTNLGGLATNLTATGLTVATGQTNTHLTASSVVVTDANKGIISSATTATELGFVSGVTSALQTQIDAKAASATLGGYVTNLGGLATNLTATGLTVATGQTNTHLTASSVVVTDANKGIVSGTTTADLATLSANQTFTGTNTFNAFSINQGGDSGWTNLRSFYRSTQIAYRVLLKTNFGAVQFFDANTNATSPSSNGGYAFCKAGYEVTIPPLLGSNSVLSVLMFFYKTNATLSSFTPLLFAGPSTNFASSLSPYSLSAADQRFSGPGFTTPAHLANADSYTLQWTYPVNGNSTLADAPIAVVDTSIPFKLYIGFTSTTGATNVGFYGFQISEQVMSP